MSRKAFPLAAVLVFCALPLCAQENLEQRFQEALEKRDWARVIELGEKLDARTSSSGLAYNLACAHAQSGSPEAAVAWLAKAAERGFQGISLLETDPDLDPIRGRPGFAEAAERVRSNRRAGFEEFRRMAEAVEPRIIYPKKPKDDPPIVIIALHGFGGSGERIARAWRETSDRAGAILVAPDALRPAGSGFSWTFRDEAEWLVLETLRKTTARFGLKSPRVVLVGFSQGANVALAVALKHPTTFAGVIAICGHYEPWMLPAEEASPLPRVYLLTGDEDPAFETFRQAADDLKRRGLSVQLRVFSGAHEFPPNRDAELARALKFLRVR